MIETHDTFGTAFAVKNILNGINNKDISILWDIYYTLKGNESPVKTCEILGSHLRHVHIKDAIFTDNSLDRLCLTGNGNIPIHEVIHLLKKVNYSEFLSFEWEKACETDLEEPEVAFPQYVRYIKNLG